MSNWRNVGDREDFKDAEVAPLLVEEETQPFTVLVILQPSLTVEIKESSKGTAP